MCHERAGTAPGPVHPQPTSSSRHLCYFFHPKHHNPKDKSESQWLLEPSLTRNQEFAIFDEADLSQTADSKGHLYGVRRVNGRLEKLGTLGQKVARFWYDEQQPWHGHPICPIAMRNCKRLLRPVPREALDRMLALNLITTAQRDRLLKGKA